MKNVKIGAELPVPLGLVTLTPPEAPFPTIAVISMFEFTLKDEAGTPPKLTAVVPSKFVPVMVIAVPVVASIGKNVVIVGNGCVNVKPANVAVPPTVVTTTFPELPFATTAVIEVGEFTVKLNVLIPPKLTPVTPIKFVPVIVTDVPVVPIVGVNDVIVGGE
jgi:hypothetical protein